MVIMKMPFVALSDRGNERSRERTPGKAVQQHDGCLLGRISSL